MSSYLAPFFNVVTADPVQATQNFCLDQEIIEALMRYQQYLPGMGATGGISLQQLRQLRGGTIAIAINNGVVTITLTPSGTVTNPPPV